MDFLGFKISCSLELTEILIAELGEVGFGSMMETEHGLEAYISTSAYDEQATFKVFEKYRSHSPITFDIEKVKKINWNEEWEKHYDPIVVEDTVLVRASFHSIEKKYPYEIVVDPKMSFGTGHHATTWLMMKNQLKVEFRDKLVMDAGCGTGILSVLSEKLGASKVTAFDVDEWSIRNGGENLQLNQCTCVDLQMGSVENVALPHMYDVILANINKNVLLHDLPFYAQHLKKEGFLLISGFYQKDEPELVQQADTLRLLLSDRDNKETWSCLIFRKGD